MTTANNIIQWLKSYSQRNGNRNFVIGVSGGVDSALTSTLCAETQISTVGVSLPIHQQPSQLTRAHFHLNWLKQQYPNVSTVEIDLSQAFESFRTPLLPQYDNALGFANSRSRLRMTALYQIATSVNGLVVGTGNKVEDYGVGFFTKYGDGGVDISPIGDLLKSEVRQMAAKLGIADEIISAQPTDGLWEDNRSDEEQLGASYEELEWAMQFIEQNRQEPLNSRQKEILEIYQTHHNVTLHKIAPIPVWRKKTDN